MTIHNLEELLEAWRKADIAMSQTIEALREITADPSPFEIAYKIRFEQSAFDPLDSERALNLTEHLNQLFTCLVSFAAAHDLHINHNTEFPINLNIGARRGFDIEARESEIKGECFAAVSPKNNGKMKNDIARLKDATATRKFLYYYSPNPLPTAEGNIQIISLTKADLKFPAPRLHHCPGYESNLD